MEERVNGTVKMFELDVIENSFYTVYAIALSKYLEVGACHGRIR